MSEPKAPKADTTVVEKYDWPKSYEKMIEDCDDYEDDGNRAVYDGDEEY